MKAAESKQSGRFYEFGPFRLDSKERVLLRADKPLALTPKAFDLLLVLVENRGHILEKGELMRLVWPNAFVEENNLAQNISLLRKVLCELDGETKCIETIPRRGYRFTAEVRTTSAEPENRVVIEHVRSSMVIEEEEQTEDEEKVEEATSCVAWEVGRAETEPQVKRQGQVVVSSLPSGTNHYIAATSRFLRKRRLAVALAIALLLAGSAVAYLLSTHPKTQVRAAAKTRRLAILPFRNLKPDGETNFLELSLADAIINKLGFINTLIVRPSSYIEKYRGHEIDPHRVANELDVDTLLTGSFLKDGDQLRVNTQLIDVNSNEILWRDTMDVKYDRLLTVQDHVAQQVIKGLQLNISPAESERLKLDAPQNPLAYENFLRGRYLISTNDHRTAIRMLEESVALDPNYALAWAYLGKAYSVTASQYFGGREFQDKAKAAYNKALALNPQQLEARVLLANFLTENNRVEEAVPLLRKVIEDNPNHPFAHWELSYAYRYAGMLDDSIQQGEQALQLYPNLTGQLFNSYFYAGEYEKFVKSLPQRDDAYTLFYRGLGYYYMKDMTRAAVYFDRAYQLDSSTIISQIGKAFKLNIDGKPREGLELLQAAERRLDNVGAADGEISYKLAQGFAVLGDNASALRLLRRAIAEGFFCYPYFNNDPLLGNLRREQEFVAVIEQARKRHEEFKRRFF